MSTSPPQGNQLKFKHADIRKLDQDQRKSFQAALDKRVSHFKRIAPAETVERKLTNYEILRKMKSLRTHLKHVCAASGPESEFQAHFWGQYIGWKASDDDRERIAAFPKMAELMYRIVDDSITSESYKIVRSVKDAPQHVAMQAASLLRQFGIEPKAYEKGVWFALTKYMLLHGYGRDEGTANICNFLKEVMGFFNAKKGVKKT